MLPFAHGVVQALEKKNSDKKENRDGAIYPFFMPNKINKSYQGDGCRENAKKR
ncbi:hypothetical protein ROR02_10200 [Pararhodospirillum oryzae]|uniref:Uncharacterized protein n=1 Tax=Pararhodospirillum oryzae TaxID=478448 RepID=A0A512H5Z7_9PROT|nr:hypothetical protein ROR02_10200 [Pararhodospirillum oryzae]